MGVGAHADSYAVALEAVGEAQRQLGGSIPFKRPDDYYADMLKSDEHMVRVKALLLKEKGRLEDAASKRKHRESAKFAKQVAAERTQERAKEKRVEQGVIRKWRRLHNQTVRRRPRHAAHSPRAMTASSRPSCSTPIPHCASSLRRAATWSAWQAASPAMQRPRRPSTP